MPVQYHPAPNMPRPRGAAQPQRDPVASFVDSFQVGLQLGSIIKSKFDIQSPRERRRRKHLTALLAKPDKTEADLARIYASGGQRALDVAKSISQQAIDVRRANAEIRQTATKHQAKRKFDEQWFKYQRSSDDAERKTLMAGMFLINPDRAMKWVRYENLTDEMPAQALDEYGKKQKFIDDRIVEISRFAEPERRGAFGRMMTRMRKNPKMGRSFVSSVENQLRVGLTDPRTAIFGSDARMQKMLKGGMGTEDFLKRKREERMQKDHERKVQSDEFRGFKAIVDDETGAFSEDERAKAANRMKKLMGLGGDNEAAADDPLNPGGPGAVVAAAATGAPAEPAADPAAAAPVPGPAAAAPGPGPAALSLLRPGGQIDDRRAADVAAMREADQQAAATPTATPAANRRVGDTGQIADRMIGQVDKGNKERTEAKDAATAQRAETREQEYQTKNPDLTAKVGDVDVTFKKTSELEIGGKSYNPRGFDAEEAKRMKRWIRKFRARLHFRRLGKDSFMVFSKGGVKPLKWRGLGTPIVLESK